MSGCKKIEDREGGDEGRKKKISNRDQKEYTTSNQVNRKYLEQYPYCIEEWVEGNPANVSKYEYSYVWVMQWNIIIKGFDVE